MKAAFGHLTDLHLHVQSWLGVLVGGRFQRALVPKTSVNLMLSAHALPARLCHWSLRKLARNDHYSCKITNDLRVCIGMD